MINRILEDWVAKFMGTKAKGLQLDLFRQNGEVLLQVFAQADTMQWENPIELTDEGGIIIQLLFHKDKTENEENRMRFLKSHIYRDFERLSFYGQEAYFKGISSGWDSIAVSNFLYDVLNTVYDLDSESINVTLNAY